jgi:glycosyltransferase involved in cell wall biosynthesis
MRLILVEPSLSDQKGHYFLVASVLSSEMKKRQVDYAIFGNLQANEECRQLGNFHPSYVEITNTILKKGVSLKNSLYLCRLIKQFKAQLNASLFHNPCFSIKDDDIILFHTLHFIEFAVLGCVLWRNSGSLRKKRTKVFVGFNHPLKRESFLISWILAAVYLITDKLFINRSKINIVYFSGGDVLAKQFQRLLNKDVVFLPAPIWPFPYQPDMEAESKGSSAKRDGKLIIAYLGGARYSKGFDIFVKMAEILSSDSANEKTRLLAHVNINETQSGNDFKTTQEYIQRLHSLRKNAPDLEIITGTLSAIEYYKLIYRCDIIVLPYREFIYRSVGSNIFNEIIIAGKVPVVPSHTYMADCLSGHSLGDLVFGKENVSDLIKAVKNIANKYKYYQEKLKNLQEEYKQVNSRDNFVNSLLKV